MLSTFFPSDLSIFSVFADFASLSISPCAMYWEDFRSVRERKHILRTWEQKGVAGNRLQALDELLRDNQRLLANWGMIGRKMWSNVRWETNYEWRRRYVIETRLRWIYCS